MTDDKVTPIAKKRRRKAEVPPVPPGRTASGRLRKARPEPEPQPPPNRRHVGAPEELLPRAEVLYRTGMAKSTLYHRVFAGTFPRPVHISPRSVRWVASQVDAWVARKIAAEYPAQEPEEATAE